MKQRKWNSMKMVISIAGMAICLLGGCVKDKSGKNSLVEQEQAAGAEQAESGDTESENKGIFTRHSLPVF